MRLDTMSADQQMRGLQSTLRSRDETISSQSATIATQRAEIERLKSLLREFMTLTYGMPSLEINKLWYRADESIKEQP
jgi:hypothetical protein